MKVLVVGSGAREHALGTFIHEDPTVEQLYFVPGNPGTKKIGKNIPIDIKDFSGIKDFVIREEIDLVVVGPEAPLVDGITDVLEDVTKVFGPSKGGAILEKSKEYSKNFMEKYNIPTGSSIIVRSFEEAVEKGNDMPFPHVWKLDGLAAGKGVLIVREEDDEKQILKDIWTREDFQGARDSVLLEEYLEGPEVSVFVLIDDESYSYFSNAMDYKKAKDNDEGLNTGGMGAISPVADLSEKEEEEIRNIVEKTVEGIRKENLSYRGVIFIGCIRTLSGVKTLEYNVRFGDPETQVVLSRFQGNLGQVLLAVADDRLKDEKITFSSERSICVVLASGGYPEKFEKNKRISIKPIQEGWVFHAGTKEEGNLVTSGGRVFSVVAKGKTFNEARKRVYDQLRNISFDAMEYRKDIGKLVKEK